MKKISFILIALVLLSAAVSANAATLSTTPAAVNVVAGQTFSLPISVNSQGASVVTVKAQLSYPSNLVDATAFSFGSGWMQLSQPGYDSMGSGVLIKTAGFPGGFGGTKTLGTVTFVAKATGTATIILLGFSFFTALTARRMVKPVAIPSSIMITVFPLSFNCFLPLR